jgi:hypothetical protein
MAENTPAASKSSDPMITRKRFFSEKSMMDEIMA